MGRGEGAGPTARLLALAGAAVAIGGLLGGSVSLVLFLFTDWFDPIADYVHERGFWGGGRP
ncbi:hypothetical protein ACFVVX_35130 [Kitasatospora sp. NPDC058170]|uniref:hypothetical protein n=1 Tax=Kitasatospora sp. NPDC058170 TaxID=3346364 RepID=UPI0036DC303A